MIATTAVIKSAALSIGAILMFIVHVLSFGIVMSIAFNIGKWITKKIMPWAYNA